MPVDILLVDDNRDAAELLEELLSMEGHTTRTAGTAAQALALMQRGRPTQPENPPASRKAFSSGVESRPKTALRCGKRPKR